MRVWLQGVALYSQKDWCTNTATEYCDINTLLCGKRTGKRGILDGKGTTTCLHLSTPQCSIVKQIY